MLQWENRQINRDTKYNLSIIKIERNNSANLGEQEITPENGVLTPYFGKITPENKV